MEMTVLSPKGTTRQIARRLSPRLAKLDGVKVGLLSNQKANAESLLMEIAQLFSGNHDCSTTIVERKPDVSRPAELAMLTRVADRADFMITAIGD